MTVDERAILANVATSPSSSGASGVPLARRTQLPTDMETVLAKLPDDIAATIRAELLRGQEESERLKLSDMGYSETCETCRRAALREAFVR